MADVVSVRTEEQGGTHRHVWAALNDTDLQGDAVSIPGAADRTVQITGVFGGATVIIEGSLLLNASAAADFATLSDPQGIAISKSAAAIVAILENTAWTRPRLTGATGTTDLTVTMLSRK